MGTDLLITVNVPYPDEDAAATSAASAECFRATTAGASVSEAPPAAAQAPAVAGDAASEEGGSTVGTEVSREAERTREAPTEEALLRGDGIVGVPQQCTSTREGASGTSSAAEGGEDSQQISSCASVDCFDAGVEALRPLLHSFAILDWSLFG